MSVNFQLSFTWKCSYFVLILKGCVHWDCTQCSELMGSEVFLIQNSKDAVLVCSGFCLDKPEVVWLVLLYVVFHFPLVSNFHFIFSLDSLTVGVWAGFSLKLFFLRFSDFLIGKFKYLIIFGKTFAMVFQVFFILFSFSSSCQLLLWWILYARFLRFC